MSANNLIGSHNRSSAVFQGYETDPKDPHASGVHMLNIQVNNKLSLLDSGELTVVEGSASGLAQGSQVVYVDETEGKDFGNLVQTSSC